MGNATGPNGLDMAEIIQKFVVRNRLIHSRGVFGLFDLHLP